MDLDQITEFKTCFDMFDASGDGTVDSSELYQIMRCLGQKVTRQEVQVYAPSAAVAE